MCLSGGFPPPSISFSFSFSSSPRLLSFFHSPPVLGFPKSMEKYWFVLPTWKDQKLSHFTLSGPDAKLQDSFTQSHTFMCPCLQGWIREMRRCAAGGSLSLSLSLSPSLSHSHPHTCTHTGFPHQVTVFCCIFKYDSKSCPAKVK